METIDARPPLGAPEQSGGTLIYPAWERLPSVALANRARRRAYEYNVQGKSLVALASAARGELVAAATRYTAKYRDLPPVPSPDGAVILAGHQPQLFHAGVWFKNFALGRLAAQAGGVGVNLLIDSDSAKSMAIRVPVGDAKFAQAETVPFDRPAPPFPYEEKTIADAELFTSFGDRAAALLRPLIPNPLIEEYWPIAVSLSNSIPNLGQCISAARHRLEGAWGNSTLELPASEVCRTNTFRQMVAHLIAHLPRFLTAHNSALADYRAAHRLRGHAHPAPDLAEEGEWLEAPFWIWSAAAPARRRLFVRDRGDAVELSDRGGFRGVLDVTADGSAETAVDQLAQLDARGIRIRSRALITTMFARLFLCDLFLHGIGGAKYDLVTDEIIRRFFGEEPTDYATLSATLRLPTAAPAIPASELQRLRHAIREVAYQPERFLPPLNDLPLEQRNSAAALVELKKRFVAMQKTPENAAERHRAIAAANAKLQPLVDSTRQSLCRRHAELAASGRALTVLQSREYAFCLHPRDRLKSLLVDSFQSIR